MVQQWYQIEASIASARLTENKIWMIQLEFLQSQTKQWITKRTESQPQKTSTMTYIGILRSPVVIPTNPKHRMIRDYRKRGSREFPTPQYRTQSRAHRHIVMTQTSTRRYKYRNTERFTQAAKDSVRQGHSGMKAHKCRPKKSSWSLAIKAHNSHHNKRNKPQNPRIKKKHNIRPTLQNGRLHTLLSKH